jgi:hypothetical protein
MYVDNAPAGAKFHASEETRQPTHLWSRTQVSDLTIEGAWVGPVRLHQFDHAPARDELPVLEIVAPSRTLADRTLAPLRSCTISRSPAAPEMADGLHWTRWRRRYHGMTSDRRTQVLNLGALSTNRPITSSAAPPMLTP